MTLSHRSWIPRQAWVARRLLPCPHISPPASPARQVEHLRIRSTTAMTTRTRRRSISGRRGCPGCFLYNHDFGDFRAQYKLLSSFSRFDGPRILPGTPSTRSHLYVNTNTVQTKFVREIGLAQERWYVCGRIVGALFGLADVEVSNRLI